MALQAGVGWHRSTDSRTAANRAVQMAMEQVGRAPVFLGLVAACSEELLQQAVSALSGQAADVPVWGFGTTTAISPAGSSDRSVTVAVLTGAGVQVQAGWRADYAQDSRTAARQMLQLLGLPLDGDSDGSIVLVAADGLGGDPSTLMDGLAEAQAPVVGCLAGGELLGNRTVQAGGWQMGAGGLAAARLSGRLALGVGAATGWRPVGATGRLTRVQGPWVRQIDDVRPSEWYGRWFERPARDWSFPPLNELARLYPLGVEGIGDMIIRSPLRVEADGSLRMGVALPEFRTVHVMVGSTDACLEAAEAAAQEALTSLGAARPVLALIFVDASWPILFGDRLEQVIQAVRRVLGQDIPLIGGATFGQIAPGAGLSPALLNQQIMIAIIGEKPA